MRWNGHLQELVQPHSVQPTIITKKIFLGNQVILIQNMITNILVSTPITMKHSTTNSINGESISIVMMMVLIPIKLKCFSMTYSSQVPESQWMTTIKNFGGQ